MAKYNQAMREELYKHLESGMTKKDAAMLSGVVEGTFYRWLNEDKKFKLKVEKSIAKYKRKLIMIVNIQSKEDGRLALEVLARRWPEEFGTKQRLEVINPHEEINKIIHLIDGEEAEVEQISENGKSILPEQTVETVRAD